MHVPHLKKKVYVLFNGLAVRTVAASTLLARCSLWFRRVVKARRFRGLLKALQLQALLLASSHQVNKKGAFCALSSTVVPVSCAASFLWPE